MRLSVPAAGGPLQRRRHGMPSMARVAHYWLAQAMARADDAQLDRGRSLAFCRAFTDERGDFFCAFVKPGANAGMADSDRFLKPELGLRRRVSVVC